MNRGTLRLKFLTLFFFSFALCAGWPAWADEPQVLQSYWFYQLKEGAQKVQKNLRGVYLPYQEQIEAAEERLASLEKSDLLKVCIREKSASERSALRSCSKADSLLRALSKEAYSRYDLILPTLHLEVVRVLRNASQFQVTPSQYAEAQTLLKDLLVFDATAGELTSLFAVVPEMGHRLCVAQSPQSDEDYFSCRIAAVRELLAGAKRDLLEVTVKEAQSLIQSLEQAEARFARLQIEVLDEKGTLP